MKHLQALCLLAALIGSTCATAAQTYGAQGPEGAPHRRQVWSVPSPDPNTSSRAVLFRPPGKGPFPLAIIAHASTQNALRRAQMPQPEYRALASRFVSHGYAVLVPERPGHGASGGRYLEDQGGCDDADYLNAGRATAESIATAMTEIRKQPFIRHVGTIVVGHSAGGWGALAMASANPQGVRAIVAFAPGRGGHANDRPSEVCAPQRLIAAAASFGQTARVPVIWLVARNDSYFSTTLSRQLADAFRKGSARVDLRELPDFRNEGHWLAESDGGDDIYGAALDKALKAITARPAKTR
jgi:dienelactone hydrolase